MTINEECGSPDLHAISWQEEEEVSLDLAGHPRVGRMTVFLCAAEASGRCVFETSTQVDNKCEKARRASKHEAMICNGRSIDGR